MPLNPTRIRAAPGSVHADMTQSCPGLRHRNQGWDPRNPVDAEALEDERRHQRALFMMYR